MIELKDIYDKVAKYKKCNCEYGYDLPPKYIKKILGKRIKLDGYKDKGLCPMCDDDYKDKPKIKTMNLDKNSKPKGLYTSETTNNGGKI